MLIPDGLQVLAKGDLPNGVQCQGIEKLGGIKYLFLFRIPPNHLYQLIRRSVRSINHPGFEILMLKHVTSNFPLRVPFLPIHIKYPFTQQAVHPVVESLSLPEILKVRFQNVFDVLRVYRTENPWTRSRLCWK